ncbi:hypothetical protein ALC53_02669 [Atta colombica]|uniref:Uncharacterized protein n=1 Tax=Atta colombica TaxID=520822 RepID=A0A195BQN2_9HYME|nr:hypothetical protein ALC53_02669 [Atta colombica]
MRATPRQGRCASHNGRRCPRKGQRVALRHKAARGAAAGGRSEESGTGGGRLGTRRVSGSTEIQSVHLSRGKKGELAYWQGEAFSNRLAPVPRILHPLGHLAVLQQKITKKRGELIAATGMSITLYYTVEPSSLAILLVVSCRLGISLVFLSRRIYTSGQRTASRMQVEKERWKTDRDEKTKRDGEGRKGYVTREPVYIEMRKRERLEMVITKKGNELFPSTPRSNARRHVRTHARGMRSRVVCACVRVTFHCSTPNGWLTAVKGMHVWLCA